MSRYDCISPVPPNSRGARPPVKLRVLVFTTVFPNPGMPLHGTFVLERIRHVAQLADIEVVVPIPWFRLFSAPIRQDKAILAVRHPRFWYIPKFLKSLRGIFLFISVVGGIARIRRTFDFDLIDAHFAYPDGFAAVLLGWWFRRPVCVTLRGTIVQWWSRPIGKWLCVWAMRRAERVITVAESLAAYPRLAGVPDHRITIIPNAVDTDRFRLLDRASTRRAVGLPEQGQVLVSIGHISPRKGFHRVIRSLPRVLETCPHLIFAIIGGPGAEENNSAALEALIERLGLSKSVLLAGAKPPEEVALWLGAADVFVLASDFEGCPNVVLEAMASGRPVIATKVGDIERMVPRFAGILFDDPEDDRTMADCINEALAREWDSKRIREHVVARSWSDVAERVMTEWRLGLVSFRAREAQGVASSREKGIGTTTPKQRK
jgi:teichuronic acid biosynthesis glycosyltransferase TuaC